MTDFERADASGDPYARERAAERLAGAHLLVTRSASPMLDADGLRCLRQALDQALRHASDRTERRPVADPRDKPQRLDPDTTEQREAQARARRVLAELRGRCDAWHRAPERFSYAEVVALLGDLSRGCEMADRLRAIVPAPVPAPVPISKRHRR